MQLSNAPTKLVLPFANAGGKNSIPVASQVGITPGAASQTDGFPPLTRTPIASGGIPPSGLDMNGILFEATAIGRWNTAGAGYVYDATFAADSNVGGYPKGARVLRTDGEGYWLCVADNTATDPEAGSAGWVPDYTSGAATIAMSNANVTLTSLQAGRPIIIITGTLTANLNLVFPGYVKQWLVINRASGAYSVTCKTASGTGVAVPTGVSAQLFGDGTNIDGQVFSSSTTAATVGAFRNLRASASGTAANISVTADEIIVESSANNYQTLRAVSLTVAGTSVGANGLDAGTIATSTWYSLWVIWNGATTACLMSLSATAPTLPSGYTHKARVGQVRTDGTANKFPLGFVQYGRRVQYKIAAGSNLTEFPVISSGSNGAVLTATSVAAVVPPTAASVSILCGFSSTPSTNTSIFVCANAAGTFNNSMVGISQGGSGQFSPLVKADVVLESQNIYVSSNSSVGLVNVNGWEDNL